MSRRAIGFRVCNGALQARVSWKGEPGIFYQTSNGWRTPRGMLLAAVHAPTAAEINAAKVALMVEHFPDHMDADAEECDRLIGQISNAWVELSRAPGWIRRLAV